LQSGAQVRAGRIIAVEEKDEGLEGSTFEAPFSTDPRGSFREQR
jgi:hypothetical protein